jgi:hypothetical protein
MVLAGYGLELPEKRLRELCGWTPHGLISSTTAMTAALSLGFIHSREDYGLRLHDLRDEIRSGVFPIVGVDLSFYGNFGRHAQVVVSISSRGVTLQDPLLGQFVSSPVIFEEAWSITEYLTILIE